MYWLQSHLADIVVIILLLALLYICFRSVFTKKGACCGCTGNCATCALAQIYGKKTAKLQ